MSIRPCLGAGVPELTARVARASNPAGTTAMWVRDRLDGLWDDEDFAGWYSRDGRPGISPAQLATVSVLQFLLDLSDRDAAEAVRCRIDFKYALGLDLDDPGFHHSVLSDFRDRLLEDGRADRLLDLALARLKEAWLVRERTSQRTDSTHVLAAVRDLTRLELVTEAVRAALEEVARTAGHALEGLAGDDWGRRYGRPVRLDKNPTRPKTRMNDTGADARLLLEHLAASFTGLLRGPRRCPATAPASTATGRATPATPSASTSTARRSPARRARSATGGTAPTRPPRPTPPRSSSPASPRASASPVPPGPPAPPPATASAPWASPRANCTNCRSATAPTSKTPPGTSATPSGPASRAPSASSPAATACATAATEASPRPTSSTCSPPSPSTSNASAAQHPRREHIPATTDGLPEIP